MILPRFFFSALLACALAATAVCAAKAGASAWYETDGARIRIVAEPAQTGESQLRAVLQVELEPGWKTYWREPGASGIPPQLTVDGEGVEETTIHFPVPVRVSDQSGSWAGYTAPVSLPLTIGLGGTTAPATLQADVFLGVCREVCIPVTTDLEIPLTGRRNMMQSLVIDAAFAGLAPQSADALAVDSLRWTDGGDLEIVLADTASPQETEVFLAAGSQHAFKPPRRVSSAGGRSVFRAEPLFDPSSAGALDITVAARSGAETIETTLTVPGA